MRLLVGGVEKPNLGKFSRVFEWETMSANHDLVRGIRVTGWKQPTGES